MNTVMRKACTALRVSLLLGLAGCVGIPGSGAPFAPEPPPQDGKGLVYIYRPHSLMLGGRDAQFYVDGRKVAAVSSSGFTKLYLDPGTYTLKQKWTWDLAHWPAVEQQVTVVAGSAVYFRFFAGDEGRGGCGPQKGGGVQICYQWSLGEVTEAEAMPEISLCSYWPPQPEKKK